MKGNSLAFASEQISEIPSWSNYHSSKQDQSEANHIDRAFFDSPWIALAESLREGVMVISRQMKPVYLNQQAKETCQKLANGNRQMAVIPSAISEVCHLLIRNVNSGPFPLAIECQTVESETIRLRASWLNLPTSDAECLQFSAHQYILVFLENRNQILQEELQFDQQKYQFTDREMEIWALLRQDYSYQDIAKTLQISLNTVKTHVKNIYAKKRWTQVKDMDEVC